MNLAPGPLDTLFHALADPTRRAVLERLSHGPASVTELAAPFAMALPSFLAHITRLETAGLVISAKSGRVRQVALVPGACIPLRSWLDDQHSLWNDRLDRFDAYVTRLAKDNSDGP